MKVIEAEKAQESQDFNNSAAAVATFCAERHLMQGQSQEGCGRCNNGFTETKLIQNLRVSRATLCTLCLE